MASLAIPRASASVSPNVQISGMAGTITLYPPFDKRSKAGLVLSGWSVGSRTGHDCARAALSLNGEYLYGEMRKGGILVVLLVIGRQTGQMILESAIGAANNEFRRF